MMHETYRILAESRIEEHLREAGAWRMAREGHSTARRRPGLVARIRGLLPQVGDQRPVPAATGQALVPDASCRP